MEGVPRPVSNRTGDPLARGKKHARVGTHPWIGSSAVCLKQLRKSGGSSPLPLAQARPAFSHAPGIPPDTLTWRPLHLKSARVEGERCSITMVVRDFALGRLAISDDS